MCIGAQNRLFKFGKMETCIHHLEFLTMPQTVLNFLTFSQPSLYPILFSSCDLRGAMSYQNRNLHPSIRIQTSQYCFIFQRNFSTHLYRNNYLIKTSPLYVLSYVRRGKYFFLFSSKTGGKSFEFGSF